MYHAIVVVSAEAIELETGGTTLLADAQLFQVQYLQVASNSVIVSVLTDICQLGL